MIHSGNSFQKADNPDILVVDATVYEDADKNVYEVFDFEGLKTKEQLKGKKFKGYCSRFELNLKTGELNQKKLLHLTEGGNYELPTFNDKYDGVKENCYTYLIEFFGQQNIDDNYGWDLVKYDACQEKIAARWSQDSNLPSEPYFIADPNGTEEDDGVIMNVSYDF